MTTKAALLITLRTTGRWRLTISRTFVMEKVHSEHIDDAPFVNPIRITADIAGHGLNVTA